MHAHCNIETGVATTTRVFKEVKYPTTMPSAKIALCFGPSLLAVIALILTICANSRCNVVKPNFPELLNNFPNVPDAVGLWCYESNNGTYYDARDIPLDSKYKAARGLGTTASVFGWLLVMFFLIATCLPVPAVAFKIGGFVALLTFLFQSLIFLIYKAGICANGCDLDWGGKCGISAVVFWFLTGVTSIALSKQLAERLEEEEEDLPQANAAKNDSPPDVEKDSAQ